MSDHHWRAKAALDLGHWNEAERLAREGLMEDPDEPYLYGVLAQAMVHSRDQQRWDEARSHAERALALAPDDTWMLRIGGWVHRRGGDLESAAELLERAVTIDPAEADNHRLLAGTLLQQAHEEADEDICGPMRERARAHAEQALDLAPEDPESHLVMARHRMSIGDAVGARRWTEGALEIEPDHAEAHQLLGLIAHWSGDLRTASRHYVDAGRLDPRDDLNMNMLRGMGWAAPIMGLVLILATWLITMAVTGVGGSWRSYAVVSAATLLLVAYLRYRPRWSARRQMTPEARSALAVDRRVRRR